MQIDIYEVRKKWRQITAYTYASVEWYSRAVCRSTVLLCDWLSYRTKLIEMRIPEAWHAGLKQQAKRTKTVILRLGVIPLKCWHLQKMFLR